MNSWDLREKAARIVYFVHGDDLTVEAALSPSNDAHWEFWRAAESGVTASAFAAADAILELATSDDPPRPPAIG